MKYLVYPPGFDPFYTSKKLTREQVQRQELLASLAKVKDAPPKDNRWYVEQK